MPGRDGEDERAVQRAEDRADLLHGADDAEGDAAALRWVEVGDQREGRGHESAGAHSLEEPAGDHARQVVGRGGDQRAEGEDDQRADQDREPAAEVGDPPDQRQHGDVAEQES